MKPLGGSPPNQLQFALNEGARQAPIVMEPSMPMPPTLEGGGAMGDRLRVSD